MASDFDKEEILRNAEDLVKSYKEKSVGIVQQRIDNLNNNHSRESDYLFMLLNNC